MWLLHEDTARAMEDARRLGVKPTEEQTAQLAADARVTGASRVMSIAGDVAEIRVEGVLTRKPDFFARVFGGGNTLYGDVIDALMGAIEDPRVKSATLVVDSPGGTVDGFFDTIAAIELFREKKPIKAVAGSALSAGYGIAAATGRIEARNPTSEFGSVGVAAGRVFFTDMEIVEITNSDSPDKRPDVRNEQGRAVVRAYLDEIFDQFAGVIARGRSVSQATVRERFGRGAVLLASQAKERGMIDSIARPSLRVVPDDNSASAARGGVTKEIESMDLKTLKAQHPDVFEAAAAEGANQERDRVVAHLTMGERSGDIETAFAAIRNGEGMTQTLLAKYMTAGMNRSDRTSRQEETDAAATAVDNANPKEASKDMGDLVADELEKLMKGGAA